MRTYDATEQAYKNGYRDGKKASRKSCPLCNPDLRPCLVDDKPATFHRWVEEGLMWAEKLETVRTCLALVEYPDGSVGKVKPELITFLDRRAER